mmetsp:Transcript_42947/g.100894  ORF Transcript_42947/g.100894 Transcript_42947/m.100894 type:complete len:704 (-) Transcript_42947:26-2137(-)
MAPGGRWRGRGSNGYSAFTERRQYGYGPPARGKKPQQAQKADISALPPPPPPPPPVPQLALNGIDQRGVAKSSDSSARSRQNTFYIGDTPPASARLQQQLMATPGAERRKNGRKRPRAASASFLATQDGAQRQFVGAVHSLYDLPWSRTAQKLSRQRQGQGGAAEGGSRGSTSSPLPPRPPLPPGLGFGETLQDGRRAQLRPRQTKRQRGEEALRYLDEGGAEYVELEDEFLSPGGTPRGGIRALDESPPKVPPPRAPAEHAGLAPVDDGGDPYYDDFSEEDEEGETPVRYRLSPRGDPEDRRVFLHNVPFCFGEEDLAEVFSRAGHVVGLRLYRMRDGRSRGEGICEFYTAAEAARALRILPGTWLHDDEAGNERLLYVQMHREQGKDSDRAESAAEKPAIRRRLFVAQSQKRLGRKGPRQSAPAPPASTDSEVAGRVSLRQSLREVSDGRRRKIPGSERAIFFYNVPPMTTKQLLHRLLSLAGRIKVLKRLVTSAGVFKGMGICEYHTAESAQEALDLPGSINTESALGRLSRRMQVKPHTGRTAQMAMNRQAPRQQQQRREDEHDDRDRQPLLRDERTEAPAGDMDEEEDGRERRARHMLDSERQSTPAKEEEQRSALISAKAEDHGHAAEVVPQRQRQTAKEETALSPQRGDDAQKVRRRRPQSLAARALSPKAIRQQTRSLRPPGSRMRSQSTNSVFR